MEILTSRIRQAPQFRAVATACSPWSPSCANQVARTKGGGGRRRTAPAAGKMLVRDRIATLIDPSTPFLNPPLAAWEA
jgi:hypothetical protein